VHKFMGLGKPEMDYFINQVGLAAASFGVSKDDIAAVAGSLNTVFNRACSPPVTVIKSQGQHLQAICIDQSSCIKADKPVCGEYAAVMKPVAATAAASASSSASSAPSGTGSTAAAAAPASKTSEPAAAAAAGANGYSFAALAAGLAAFLL
ncbi:hypothetical protein E4U41_001689, partial [Claviceps citrina]